MKLYTSNKLWKSVVWEKFGENKDTLTAIGLVASAAEKVGGCQRPDTFRSIKKRGKFPRSILHPTMANADACAYAEASDPTGGLEMTYMRCVHSIEAADSVFYSEREH